MSQNMTKKIFVVGAGLAVLALAAWGLSRGETSSSEESLGSEEVIDATFRTKKETASGQYVAYSPANFTNAESDRRVLFFKADWCPTCRVLDQDIEENIEDIPDDVVILEADFDEEKELKERYRVATQHTIVLVGSSGEEIAKRSGILSLEELVEFINS